MLSLIRVALVMEPLHSNGTLTTVASFPDQALGSFPEARQGSDSAFLHQNSFPLLKHSIQLSCLPGLASKHLKGGVFINCAPPVYLTTYSGLLELKPQSLSTRIISSECEMSPQAHSFKYLVSAGSNVWEDCEAFRRGGDSIQEVVTGGKGA